MTLTMPKTDLGLGQRLNRATRADGPAASWTLARTIEAAVRKVDIHFIRPLPSQTESDSKRLLALLTWSYTRQLYSSREIFDQLHAWAAMDCWEGGSPSAWGDPPVPRREPGGAANLPGLGPSFSSRTEGRAKA